MYEAFFGFREKPFSLLPDSGFLFLGRRHSMALSLLEYGISEGSGITVITGEIGSGKTTLLRHLLNRFDDSTTVGLISNTHRAFGELLHWVLLAYGIEHTGQDKAGLFQRFVDFLVEQYAQGRKTLLIVDEAQNMDMETLEELRVLSNLNADKDQPLQLALVGQPELRETLRSPRLAQFAQRVSVDYHLGPLDLAETEAYIQHRLDVAGGDPELFDAVARRFVHHQCGGIPRLVNSLCDMALVYAFAEQRHTVDAALVQEAAVDKSRGGLFPAVSI